METKNEENNFKSAYNQPTNGLFGNILNNYNNRKYQYNMNIYITVDQVFILFFLGYIEIRSRKLKSFREKSIIYSLVV